MKALIGAGPGGIIGAFMFYQWREERSERRELQAKLESLVADKIKSDNALADALEKMAERVKA